MKSVQKRRHIKFRRPGSHLKERIQQVASILRECEHIKLDTCNLKISYYRRIQKCRLVTALCSQFKLRLYSVHNVITHHQCLVSSGSDMEQNKNVCFMTPSLFVRLGLHNHCR